MASRARRPVAIVRTGGTTGAPLQQQLVPGTATREGAVAREAASLPAKLDADFSLRWRSYRWYYQHAEVCPLGIRRLASTVLCVPEASVRDTRVLR